MNLLLSLWLPILLSAVAVFVISSVIHMVVKWHASDYAGFSNEDAVRAAIRAANPTPGRYVVPFCKDMKDMGSEAMLKKYQEGPIGHVLIGPNGAPNMGKYLGMWFVWTLGVAIVAAFVVSQIFGLDPTRARAAAKLVGAITFIAFGFGTVTESIWGMRPWSSSVKHLLDAALYAVGAGLVFYFLWP
jgi:ABC-type cobalt transport system substrate-binding protein